jgi:hypothetical protein
LGAADGHVGYATWSGVLLVDANAPQDPARQQYLPGPAGPIGDQLLFSNERALLVDPTSGWLHEITFASSEAQP